MKETVICSEQMPIIKSEYPIGALVKLSDMMIVRNRWRYEIAPDFKAMIVDLKKGLPVHVTIAPRKACTKI